VAQARGLPGGLSGRQRARLFHALKIPFDRAFASTVNVGEGYHIFLTPNGDCKGLYVASKTAGGFEVRELGGGTSSISFDYRIVAKRRGYERVRLEDITDQMNMMREHRTEMPAQHTVGNVSLPPRPSALEPAPMAPQRAQAPYALPLKTPGGTPRQ